MRGGESESCWKGSLVLTVICTCFSSWARVGTVHMHKGVGFSPPFTLPALT